jgi:hypothetical protein
VSLPRLAFLAALGCVSAAAVVLACAPFSASSEVDAGSAEASTATDGSVGGDAGECFDLTSPSPAFTSQSNARGSLTVEPSSGLAVVYPDGTTNDAGDSYATWEHRFPVSAGTTGATVTLEADIKLPLRLTPPPWYAEFGALVHGDSASDTTSIVSVALADARGGIAQRFGVDVNTFPNGGQDASLDTSNNFGFVALGAARQGVKVVLDVTWSTAATPATVVAALDNQPEVSVSAVTLQSPPVSSWTLVLGGAASGNPAMTILYTRACVRLRP